MYIIFIHISEKTLEIQVDKQVCNSASIYSKHIQFELRS